MERKYIYTKDALWLVTIHKGTMQLAVEWNFLLSDLDLKKQKPDIYISSAPFNKDKVYMTDSIYDELHRKVVIPWTPLGSYIFTENTLVLNIDHEKTNNFTTINTSQILDVFFIPTKTIVPVSYLCTICMEQENDTIVSHYDKSPNHIMCNRCAHFNEHHACQLCMKPKNLIIKFDLSHIFESNDEKVNNDEKVCDNEVDFTHSNNAEYISDTEMDVII